MGNLTEAKRWGEKLLSLDGVDADSYYLMANIVLEENRPEIAESTLKRALYLDPHHILSHFLMGHIVNRRGNKRIAARHFQNVKELLAPFKENDVLSGSDGMTAGRLKSIVENLL